MKKTAVVCGASGLIGAHMVARLKAENYYVVGIARRTPQFFLGETADVYFQYDLRNLNDSSFIFDNADECYNFAAEVGGLGYITDHANDADCLRNSTLIDVNVLEACRRYGVGKVFFASSACVYPVLKRPLKETDAYPAAPLNEFAWQKLFAERLYQSYASANLQVRIGRLFNTYGPGMTWVGGREKSVAAICRKVAELGAKQKLEVWGDGYQERSYTYVDDTVEGIFRLMQSEYQYPLNIGSDEECSIRGLVSYVSLAAGKLFGVSYVPGPVGNPSIVCDTHLMRLMLGWRPQTMLREGIIKTYPWVEKQVLTKERINA